MTTRRLGTNQSREKPPIVAALTDLRLQELREAYRRALRDGREDELYYVDCEINFRKSVNDFR